MSSTSHASLLYLQSYLPSSIVEVDIRELTIQLSYPFVSTVRDVGRTATAETPAKYGEGLFRLKWSYAQFCTFVNIPNIDRVR